MAERSDTLASLKKIVLIGFPYTNKIDTGRGIDRYLATIHKSFSRHGIGLRIIEEGVVKPRPVCFIKAFLKAFIELRKSNENAFHAVDPLGSIVAALALKKNIITTIHDTIPLDGKVVMFNPFVFFFAKLSMLVSLNISKEIIVPFESTRDALINNFQVAANKINIIHYALDLNLDQLADLNVCQDVGDDNMKILFMGGGSPNDRGLDIVLKSYRELVRDLPGATLTIVAKSGTISDENQKLLNGAKSYLIETIELIPEPELMSFLKKFRVFIYPSRLGFSFLVMQAMASGVPVITSNSRDMKDFLGDSGILCDNDEVSCYVQALVRLTDKDFRANIVKNQYERLRMFTLDNFYNEMNELYMKALYDA